MDRNTKSPYSPWRFFLRVSRDENSRYHPSCKHFACLFIKITARPSFPARKRCSRNVLRKNLCSDSQQPSALCYREIFSTSAPINAQYWLCMCTWIISCHRLKLFVASKLCVMLCDVDLYYEWFFYLRQHFLSIFFIF